MRYVLHCPLNPPQVGDFKPLESPQYCGVGERKASKTQPSVVLLALSYVTPPSVAKPLISLSHDRCEVRSSGEPESPLCPNSINCIGNPAHDRQLGDGIDPAHAQHFIDTPKNFYVLNHSAIRQNCMNSRHCRFVVHAAVKLRVIVIHRHIHKLHQTTIGIFAPQKVDFVETKGTLAVVE